MAISLDPRARSSRRTGAPAATAGGGAPRAWRHRIVPLLSMLLVLGALGFAVPPANAGVIGGLLAPTTEAPSDSDRSFTLGDRRCELIEVPTAAPVGLLETCPGVRPGALVTTPLGVCTLNFAFTDAKGNAYIGTAGHCVLGQGDLGGADGEKIWEQFTGPAAKTASGEVIGNFTYAALKSPRDFALIRLNKTGKNMLNPSMCHFGGPTGINRDIIRGQVVTYEYFGQGVIVGDVVPGRTGIGYGAAHPDHLFMQGAAVPGDSGSGVLTADGRAIGVVVSLGAHLAGIGTDAVDAGVVGVTRLGPQVDRAEKSLGTDLTLMTAPSE